MMADLFLLCTHRADGIVEVRVTVNLDPTLSVVYTSSGQYFIHFACIYK